MGFIQKLLNKIITKPNNFPNCMDIVDAQIRKISKLPFREFTNHINEMIEMLNTMPVEAREKVRGDLRIAELNFLKHPSVSALERVEELTPPADRENRKKEFLKVLFDSKDHFSPETLSSLLSFFFESENWAAAFQFAGCVLHPSTLPLLSEKYRLLCSNVQKQKSFAQYFSSYISSSKFFDLYDVEMEFPVWEFILEIDIDIAFDLIVKKNQKVTENYARNQVTAKRKVQYILWLRTLKAFYYKANKGNGFNVVLTQIVSDIKKKPSLVKEVRDCKDLWNPLCHDLPRWVHSVKMGGCCVCSGRHNISIAISL